MRRVLAVLAASVVPLGLIAPSNAARSDESMVSEVILEDADPSTESSVTIRFDTPSEIAGIERDLEATLGAPVEMDVQNGTVRAEVSSEEPIGATSALSAQDSDYGRQEVRCDTSRWWSDNNATFGVQRQCGVRAAPWYIRLSLAMQDLCISNVSELGMRWTKNGVNQPGGASHYYADNATIHGTFRGHGGVGAGDIVDWYDQLHCRHGMQGGGDVMLEMYGTLIFRAA